MPDHCWIYLRKSRALGDPDDPKLLEHHLSALLRLAEREGLENPIVVQEIGSAETIAARPRFAALLREWEGLPPGVGGVLLLTEIERLSRGSLAERGRIVDALAAADLRVLTLSRPYNLRDPDDATWFTIFSELGKRELDKFKQRLALKLADLLREGRTRNGRAPYGYEWDPKLKDWIAHPDRFPVLQAWCAEISSMSLRRIGAKWGVPYWVVHDTLSNPAICGWPAKRTALHKGTKPWKAAAALLPRDQWVWPERAGNYPAACSRARWEQIQQEIGHRRETRAKTHSSGNAWGRDLVRFASHPETKVYLSSNGNAPVDDPLRALYAAAPQGSPRLYVPRQVVHTAAEAALRRVFAHPELIAQAIAAYQESRAAAPPPGESPSRSLARERTQHEKRLVELLRREIDEESPVQQRALAALRRETEAAIRQLDAQLHAAQVPPPAPALDALLPRMIERLADLDAWWENSDDDLKRQLAGAFLAAVEVETSPVPGQRAWRREVLAVRFQPLFSDHCEV